MGQGELLQRFSFYVFGQLKVTSNITIESAVNSGHNKGNISRWLNNPFFSPVGSGIYKFRFGHASLIARFGIDKNEFDIGTFEHDAKFKFIDAMRMNDFFTPARLYQVFSVWSKGFVPKPGTVPKNTNPVEEKSHLDNVVDAILLDLKVIHGLFVDGHLPLDQVCVETYYILNRHMDEEVDRRSITRPRVKPNKVSNVRTKKRINRGRSEKHTD
jgi:hypothetical protein